MVPSTLFILKPFIVCDSPRNMVDVKRKGLLGARSRAADERLGRGLAIQRVSTIGGGSEEVGRLLGKQAIRRVAPSTWGMIRRWPETLLGVLVVLIVPGFVKQRRLQRDGDPCPRGLSFLFRRNGARLTIRGKECLDVKLPQLWTLDWATGNVLSPKASWHQCPLQSIDFQTTRRESKMVPSSFNVTRLFKGSFRTYCMARLCMLSRRWRPACMSSRQKQAA